MRSLFLFALPLLFGCPVQETVCTLDYRSSVTVYVYDQANTPLEQAEVRYRVDDGDWAACELLSGGFVCGWELSGAFDIDVSAVGFDPQLLELDVGSTEDGCHVASETVSVFLEALDCSAEALPAAKVSVFDAAGEPAQDASVSWSGGTSDASGMACQTGSASNVYLCAYEEWGDLTIHAESGAQAGAAEVSVEHDGCHPITESVDVQMDWLPD